MKYHVIARNKATGKNEVLKSFMDHDQAANFAIQQTVKGIHAWVEKESEHGYH